MKKDFGENFQRKWFDMKDLVLIMDNEAVYTSLQVAEKFGKQHDRVLRVMDDLKIYSFPKWGQLFKEK